MKKTKLLFGIRWKVGLATMDDDIIEALESSAPVRKDRGRMGDPTTGDKADTIIWRDGLMRFIEELDDNLTVREIRMALEDYR
jgi:hypothetical protein